VTGILRLVDPAARTATIEHAEIPGYMPAMTMPFDVKSMTELEHLKAGGPIGFTLVVTERSSWIEGVRKVNADEVHLPASTSRNAVPGAEAARWREGDLLPEFTLVDSKGREIHRETFAGRPLVLSFIYTRCPLPNFCPLISRNLQELAKETVSDLAGGRLQLLSISIDPEFDTPAVLAAYAAHYTDDTDRWRFARGTAAETQRLTQAFAVGVKPERGTISHGLATVLVNADGVIQRIWRGNGWKPAEIISALKGSAASPKPLGD
jgi:protein SCO1/2